MAELYIDYSSARPSVTTIKNAGCVGAARYVSHRPDNPKNLTHTEAARLLAGGISIVLVYESYAGRAREGAAAGRTDRLSAEKSADALGYPQDAVIFMACDYDTSRPAEVEPYLKAASEAAKRPGGPYGEASIVDYFVGRFGMEYGWQTTAWSQGKVSSKAHLLQYEFRSQWDLNKVLKPFPAWSTAAPPPPPPPGSKRHAVNDGILVRVIPGGRVTVPYGAKLINPATGRSYWKAGYHPGADWNAEGGDHGMPVLAPVEGKVVAAKANAWPINAYGLQVVIEDVTGERTAVCHLDKIMAKAGDKVHAGQQVGTVGHTGTGAHGDHCHVERRHSRFGYFDHEVVLYDYPRPGGTPVVVAEELTANSHTASVYWLQYMLNHVSLSGGRDLRLSGTFGAGTGAEVGRFQVQKCGDTADGEIGPQQLAKLSELSGLEIKIV